MPPLEEVALNIMVTTIESWETFFQWQRGLLKGKAESNSVIKKKTAALTKGLSDQKKKIESIYDYVKNNIRYVSVGMEKSGYSPENAQDVFKNKYGDCKDKSTLLISMLKTAGVPAYHILIPTHDMKNLIKDFPYPFQFNHCIVAVEIEEVFIYLDPVAEQNCFAYLPDGDQNRDVIIFKEHETVFETTPLAKPEENSSHIRKQIEIRSDGSIDVESDSYWSGSEAQLIRSFLIDSNPTEIREFLEEIVDDISPGAKLLSYSNSDPQDYQIKCGLKMEYRAEDYCKKTGDILIFPAPSIEERSSGAEKEERRYPLLLESKSFRNKEVEFNIPDGYEIYYLPEPVEIINSYFECRSSYQRKGRKILYQATWFDKAVYIPQERYSEYRKFCKMMEKTNDTYVLFKENAENKHGNNIACVD